MAPTTTGFFIIIGDLAQDPLERLFGADSFFASRGFAVAFVATVLVFPMSLTKRIHGLLLSNAGARNGNSHGSNPVFSPGPCCVAAVAIASVVGVAGVVIWRGARVVWQHEGSGEPHVVEWARGSFTVLLGLPISIFSLGCQTQVPPVVSEASPQAEKSLGAVIALGSSFCAVRGASNERVALLAARHRACCDVTLACLLLRQVLYVLTGLFGYFEFGPGVSGDIFSDYGDTSISVVIAKVVMAIHIAMASPVLMFPARRCIGFLIHRRGVAAAMAESNCTVAVLNAIMLGLTGLLAVAYPQVHLACLDAASRTEALTCFARGLAGQVATVFGFVGATIATTELYVLPAMMMMAEARVCGGDSAYASVGHTTSEAEIGETPHLSPSNTAATPHTLNHRVSTVLRNFPTPLVAYVPCGHRDLLDPRQQPERLLRAGKIMLGTGLVVGCLCTGVIIYTKAS